MIAAGHARNASNTTSSDDHGQAERTVPSTPGRRPATAAGGAGARGGCGWPRSDRAGADAGRQAAARAVRCARWPGAMRHGALRPAMVQPAGSPAGGDAGGRPADGPAGRRLSRRAAPTAWPGREQHGPGGLLAGYDDVAVRRAAPRPSPGSDRRLLRSAPRQPGAGGRGAQPAAGNAGPRRRRRRGAGAGAVHGGGGVQAAEIPVQWIVRPGLPHSIDPDGIDAAGTFLASMFRGGAAANR